MSAYLSQADEAPMTDAGRYRLAKARLLDALQNDVTRVMVPRTSVRQDTAADVFIDSATSSYERQEAFVRLLIDGAYGADISIGLKLLISTALEEFGEAEVERANR